MAINTSTPSATPTIEGKIKLAGDLGGTAESPTVVGGTATTVTTNANLTGAVTSVGNATTMNSALDDLTDVSVTLPNTGEHLAWSGTAWIAAPETPTVGSAVTYYPDATATVADNLTLSVTPSTYAETANIKTVTIATSPVLFERFVSPAIGKTTIPGGTWTFYCYAATDSDSGTNEVLYRVNKRVVVSGITGDWTGAGATRTFTAASGTPFAGMTTTGLRISAPLIETPNQTGWVTTVTSDTVVQVTITDAGYVNETGVALDAIYTLLFSDTSGDITGVTPQLYTTSTVQSAFTGLNTTDSIVLEVFGSSDNDAGTDTMTFYYGGTQRFSHLFSPNTTNHNDLGGLNVDGYKHLTAEEYTANAYRTDKLSAFAATSSSELAGVVSDETGTGALVFGTAPTLASTVTIGTAGGTTGAINLKGTTSGTVTLKAADVAGTWTGTLPVDDGTASQVLTTDGSGVMSWTTPAGGSGQTLVTKVVAASGGDYTTLGDAIAAASAGWVIYVTPGTYAESAITTTLTELTIIGAGAEKTIVTMAANNFSSTGVNCRIAGIKFTYTTGIMTVTGANAEIVNVHYSKTGAGITDLGSAEGLISGCYFNSSYTTAGLHFKAYGAQQRIIGNHFKYDAAGTDLSGLTNPISLGAESTLINGNVFESIETSFGKLVVLTGANVSFTGNTLWGKCVLLTTYTTFGTISGNTFNGRNTDVSTGVILAAASSQNTVSGNTFNLVSSGVYVSSSTYNSITGNSMLGRVASTTCSGVDCTATSAYNTISGNVFKAWTTSVNILSGATGNLVGPNNSFTDCTNEIVDAGTSTKFINPTYKYIVAANGGTHKTLGAAITTAAAGDTIFVRSGTYTESAITSSTANLTIIGENPETTVISMGANTLSLTGALTTLENLNLTFTTGVLTYTTGANKAMINCHYVKSGIGTSTVQSDGLRAVGNYFLDSSTENSAHLNMYGATSDQAVISGNTFKFNAHNTTAGTLVVGGSISGNYFLYGGAGTGYGIALQNGSMAGNVFKYDGQTTGKIIKIVNANQVTGNYFYGSNTATQLGVEIANIVTFTGNHIINMGDGILCSNGYSTIVGNYIDGIGTTAGNYGIEIANSSGDDNNISSNTIQSFEIGILVGTGNNRTAIRNNKFKSTVTTPISDTGVQTYITGNDPYDPTLEKQYLYMKNTSGGAIGAGNLVTRKAVAAGNEVTMVSTTAGDNTVLGMAVATIADTAFGYIQILGKTVSLTVDGTTDIAIGDYISHFTTAGIGQKAAAGHTAIAVALEAYTADDSLGVIDAILINPRLI